MALSNFHKFKNKKEKSLLPFFRVLANVEEFAFYSNSEAEIFLYKQIGCSKDSALKKQIFDTSAKTMTV